MDLLETEGGPNFGVWPQHMVEHPRYGAEEERSLVASLKGTPHWRADWGWQIWSRMGLWQVAI